MMGTCTDLGENEVVVFESDPVPVGRDVHVERIVFTLVQTAITEFEQLWMKRSAKQMEAEVGNFWSNR